MNALGRDEEGIFGDLVRLPEIPGHCHVAEGRTNRWWEDDRIDAPLQVTLGLGI